MDAQVLVGAEEPLDDLGDPEQQFLEAQQVQEQSRLLAPLSWGELEVQPYPHIPQDQSDADEQQTLARIARAGPDAGLVHLSVAGFDPKAHPVGFANGPRREPHLPDRVEQLLAAPLARLGMPVTLARHTDGDARAALPAAYLARQRMRIVAVILARQRPQAGGPAAFRFPPPQNRRNDEAVPGPSQVSDHRHAEKSFV